MKKMRKGREEKLRIDMYEIRNDREARTKRRSRGLLIKKGEVNKNSLQFTWTENAILHETNLVFTSLTKVRLGRKSFNCALHII